MINLNLEHGVRQSIDSAKQFFFAKVSVSMNISNMYKHDKALVHVDFSSGDFSINECVVTNEGLKERPTLLGLHFTDNSLNTDPLDFLKPNDMDPAMSIFMSQMGASLGEGTFQPEKQCCSQARTAESESAGARFNSNSIQNRRAVRRSTRRHYKTESISNCPSTRALTTMILWCLAHIRRHNFRTEWCQGLTLSTPSSPTECTSR